MAKQAADVRTKDLPIHEAWPALNNCRSLCADITTQLEQLQELFDKTAGDMRELKAAGLIYAGIHYRAEKYLYLVFPSKNGEPRVREYVGADPKKVEEALAGIKRAREYDKLKARLEAFEWRARQAGEQLAEASRWTRYRTGDN